MEEVLVDSEELLAIVDGGRQMSESDIVSNITARDIVKKVCSKHTSLDNEVFMYY